MYLYVTFTSNDLFISWIIDCLYNLKAGFTFVVNHPQNNPLIVEILFRSRSKLCYNQTCSKIYDYLVIINSFWTMQVHQAWFSVALVNENELHLSSIQWKVSVLGRYLGALFSSNFRWSSNSTHDPPNSPVHCLTYFSIVTFLDLFQKDLVLSKMAKNGTGLLSASLMMKILA